MKELSRRDFLSGMVVGGTIGTKILQKVRGGSETCKPLEERGNIRDFLKQKLGIEVTHQQIIDIIDSLEKQRNLGITEGIEILKGQNAEAYISLRKGKMDGLMKLHVEVVKKEEKTFGFPPPRTEDERIPERMSY